MKNKKGVSEMIAYVLLITISVGLSILVYSFLKGYLPLNKPECSQEISLSIDNYICSKDITSGVQVLQVNVSNRGLFSANALYLRLGPEGKKVKKLVNGPGIPKGVYIFTNNTLYPGETFTTMSYDVGSIVSANGNYELEMEPAVFTQKKPQLSLCEKSIVTQTITCTT